MVAKHKVVEFLMSLSSNYAKLGNNIKAGTFARAASSIKDSSLEEFDETTNVQFLHGIGKSVQTEVTEFVKTGTSNRAEEIKKELQSQDEADGAGSALANIKNLIARTKGK